MNFGQQRAERLAAHVGEQIEPPAMHAADDHLLEAQRHALGQEHLDQGNEAFCAAETEESRGREPLRQYALERMRPREQRQHPLAFRSAWQCALLGLQFEPLPLGRVVDVPELPSDRSAVDALKLLDE